jgi:hypothetical protein
MQFRGAAPTSDHDQERQHIIKIPAVNVVHRHRLQRALPAGAMLLGLILFTSLDVLQRHQSTRSDSKFIIKAGSGLATSHE